MRHFLPAVLLLLVCVFPLQEPVAEENIAVQPLVNLKACTPDALNGTDISNYFSPKSNEYIYVDFWASWCAPCKLSFPFMNDLHKEYESKGLKILAISVDKNKADAQKFLDRTPAAFNLAIDTSGACPKTFDVQGMPHSFILDSNGRVIYSHIGFRPGDPEKLREVIKELLKN